MAERPPEPGQPLRPTSTRKRSRCASQNADARHAAAFQSVQARLRQMSPAPTTEQATKNARQPRPARAAGGRTAPATSPRPSSQLQGLQRRQRVPDQRAVELARAARQQRGHVCAGGRVRHGQPAGRLHARRRGRRRAQRVARSADRDRRADPVARAVQSAPEAGVGTTAASSIGDRTGLHTRSATSPMPPAATNGSTCSRR